MSRRKGAAGEREVLRMLGELLGKKLTRNLSQSRAGGADCIELAGWAIEVKRVENLARPTWWAQACRQASAIGARPMLLYRRNGESWSAFIQTVECEYREGTLVDAAEAIAAAWGDS